MRGRTVGVLAALSLTGFVWPIGTAPGLGEWGRGLASSPEAVRELGRYVAPSGAALSPDYRVAFAARVRADVFDTAEARATRFLEGACGATIEVSFGRDAVARPERPLSREEARFEEGLVRVEVVACFTGQVEPEGALNAYTDPAFRMEAEPRIRSIRDDRGESCVETGGIAGLLAPTLTCHHIRRFRAAEMSAEHSQLVGNTGRPEAGGSGEGRGEHEFQDIYFKESLKTFVAIPGGVAFHYVNVTRSGDLNRIERWVGSGKIRDAEERKLAGLRGWIASRP